MRAFSCPKCGHLLFFENSRCLHCETEVGYDRAGAEFVLATPESRCANAVRAECNWIAPAGGLCDCCALTRIRPHDGDVDGLAAFARAEAAKRRLLYQLDDLGLGVAATPDCPALAFDLLSSVAEPVTTGHADGVITLDLAEGDDGHREAMRIRLDEPYRTLLGHFRHEVGHYFWMRLVDGGPALADARALFGDERADYAAALDAHYANGPAPGWESTHVSSYATAHPWEDWAETFAHYLHIRDTLQTASAFGVVVAGPEVAVPPGPDAPLASVPRETDDFDDLVNSWLPLTYALNAVNRSMGKDHLYPFVLSPAVLDKLRFVHTLITR